MGLINVGAGLSTMGGAIAQQAGTEALQQQKEGLEEQQIRLSNDLMSVRESAGRQEQGMINATAAEKEQNFQAGLETQREGSAAGLEQTRSASAEKVAAMDVAGRHADVAAQIAAPPPDVRTAQWLATATPEQKSAYVQESLTKAGVPLWMSGDGMTAPPSASPTGGVTGAPTSGGKGGAAPDTTPAPSKFNDGALQGLPPAAASTVKAMVEGRMAPPTSMAMSKPYWQGMLAAASQYDPTFDQTSWAGRVATRKDFTSGQSAKAVTALNTALGHAGVVTDAFGNLDNTSIPAVNSVKNWLGTAFGGDAQTNATQAVGALASEARKVFATTGGGNLTELENWEKNFPINGSPTQQKGAMKEFVGLLDSRLSSLSDQYNRGMQTTDDPMNLLAPHAQQVYQNLTGRQPENSTGYQNGQPPAGKAAPAPATPQDGQIIHQGGNLFKVINGVPVYQGPLGSP